MVDKVTVRNVDNISSSRGNIIFTWDGGFKQWPTVRIPAIADGNCLFHAIASAYFKPYHTGTLNGAKISKRKVVKMLRRELAHKLSQPVDPLNPDSPIYYDTLSNGNLQEFSKSAPEFSLVNMKKILDSRESLGYGFMEDISDALNKDIYILDEATEDVYVSNESNLYKGRNSLVLYYAHGHYDLVGLEDTNGDIVTYFAHDNEFIHFLRSRADRA